MCPASRGPPRSTRGNESRTSVNQPRRSQCSDCAIRLRTASRAPTSHPAKARARSTAWRERGLTPTLLRRPQGGRFPAAFDGWREDTSSFANGKMAPALVPFFRACCRPVTIRPRQHAKGLSWCTRLVLSAEVITTARCWRYIFRTCRQGGRGGVPVRHKGGGRSGLSRSCLRGGRRGNLPVRPAVSSVRRSDIPAHGERQNHARLSSEPDEWKRLDEIAQQHVQSPECHRRKGLLTGRPSGCWQQTGTQ